MVNLILSFERKRLKIKVGGYKLCSVENMEQNNSISDTYKIGKIDTEKVLNIDRCPIGNNNEVGVPCPKFSTLPAPARRALIVSSSESIDLTSSHPPEETGIPEAHMPATLKRNPAWGFSALLSNKFKISSKRSESASSTTTTVTTLGSGAAENGN